MKIGDLVKHFGREYGIIIHLYTCKWDGNVADILFGDECFYGAYCGDLEVMCK